LEAINYSIDLFKKILENHFGTHLDKGSTVEVAYSMIKLTFMRYFQFGTDEEIKNLAENSDKIKNFSFKKNSIDLKTFKGRYEIKDHSDSLNNPILIERVMGILIDLICLNQKFNIAPLLV